MTRQRASLALATLLVLLSCISSAQKTVLKTAPPKMTVAVDATGAGDCFVGVLCARLAAGDPLPDALVWANTAASLCVQRPGAAPSMPTAGEVLAAISGPPG